MKNIQYLVLASLLFLMSCDNDFDPDISDVAVQSGEADFTTYVAVGNSLTAGYADGALYKSAQENSYPAIMAQQMSLAGGGAFTQPLMPDDIGGFSDFGVDGKLRLNQNLQPFTSPAVSPFTPVNGLYNNCGVPGAKVFHLLFPGYGNVANLPNANPYYARMAAAPNNTVIQDAVAQNPTFFSLWIGNNDVLGYATNGGDGVNQTGNLNPSSYGPNDITDPNVFAGSYDALVQSLTANGAKGVVASLPSVTTIPYFNTVPTAPFTAEVLGQGDATAGAAVINDLNTQLYGPMSQVLSALGAPDRVSLLDPAGANPILIRDEYLTDLSAQITAVLTQQGFPANQATLLGILFGQARQTKSTDLVCLTTSSLLGTPNASFPPPFNINGVTVPLEDSAVLVAQEITECNTMTDAYNQIIQQIAANYNLAFYDAAADMQNLISASGITYNGVTYSASYASGGAFSLDGVHPTSKGYAIIANGFIDAINGKYNSTLPHVVPNQYPGVHFP